MRGRGTDPEELRRSSREGPRTETRRACADCQERLGSPKRMAKMGGTLFVGIRRRDGTEYISERWTNLLPFLFSNPRFWEDGEEVDEYIKMGLENFPPANRISPSTYGVTLIDFQTKRVLNRQDYCGVGQTVCSFVDAELAQNVQDLIDLGWVVRYEISRHTPLGATQEQFNSIVDDDQLHPDEVTAFQVHLRTLLIPGPFDKDGWVSHRRFEPGLVTIQWVAEGWVFDDRGNEQGEVKRSWPRILAFLKENGWRSEACTQEEVDAV
jgi:hypothetical protein